MADNLALLAWTSVESSNLKELAYDIDQEILYVRFKGNSLYAYDNVPANVNQALLDADSHGKYLEANIKPNYSYRKLS